MPWSDDTGGAELIENMLVRRLVLLVLCVAAGVPLHAEEKKPGDAARIIAVAPLEITRGVKTTLRLRGLKLDAATGVKILPRLPEIVATIGEKKKTTVPNGAEAKMVGDAELSVMIEAPERMTATSVKLVVLTSEGAAAPVEIPIVNAADFAEEKEPNGGFREAQLIPSGQVVRGCIKEDKDVDVFRFEGHAGKRVTIEIRAARLNSMLDPVLTLFGAGGSFLQTNDDFAGRDSRIVAVLTADGAYLVSVTDAQDTGSAWHGYELVLKEEGQ